MKKFVVHYVKSEKETKKDVKDDMLCFNINDTAETIKRFVADHVMTVEDITNTMKTLGYSYSKVLYADENEFEYYLFISEYEEKVSV